MSPAKTSQRTKPKTSKNSKQKTTRAPARKKGPPPFISTGFWLLKSEPESYPIERFEKDGTTLWTGVRNYQARNFMMTSMQPGDQFFFYHSNSDPTAVMGVGEIVRANQPDPTALDPSDDYHDPKASTDHPIWFCAEVAFKQKLSRPVTLAELRADKKLDGLALLAPGQRLSIQPVSPEHFAHILALGGQRGQS